jgi:hypothetical protein
VQLLNVLYYHLMYAGSLEDSNIILGCCLSCKHCLFQLPHPFCLCVCCSVLQMRLQDGAHGAYVAPYNRRFMLQQPQQQSPQGAAAAAIPIAAAMAMLLVAAVMCLGWRKRTRQQQQPQQQQERCSGDEHTLPHAKTQQACFGCSSSTSSSQDQQQQQRQQPLQLQATQPGLAAAAQQLMKQLMPLGDQRRRSSSSSRGCGSSSTLAAAASSSAATTAARDATERAYVQLSVLPMGPEEYRNSNPAGNSRSMPHGLSCRGSNSSISSSGRSDSASSIDAAAAASHSNPASNAADAASSAAASSVAANSSSTDSMCPLTTLLTEAHLLRCVTPDDVNSRYNNQTIFMSDFQPSSPAAAAAAAATQGVANVSAASPGTSVRQVHSSASSNGGNMQLRGVNAAVSGQQSCEEAAQRLPAMLFGTLTRTQAAAIKFGELLWLFLC